MKQISYFPLSGGFPLTLLRLMVAHSENPQIYQEYNNNKSPNMLIDLIEVWYEIMKNSCNCSYLFVQSLFYHLHFTQILYSRTHIIHVKSNSLPLMQMIVVLYILYGQGCSDSVIK